MRSSLLIRASFLALGLGLSSPSDCRAQAREWIVDAAGGPGAHFADLPPAVAAAASGDVILVRPGDYHGFSTSKGLQILATNSPRAPVVRAVASPAAYTIEVDGLPPTERFAVVGLEVRAPTGSGVALSLRGCVGTVHIESCGLVMNERVTGPTARPALWVSGCARVHVARSAAQGFPAAAVERSGLRATDSVFLGVDGGVFSPGAPFAAGHGVAAAFSDLEFSRCLLRGGDVLGLPTRQEGGSGLLSETSIWTLRGDANGAVIAGQSPGAPVVAARGTGRVHHDPVVTFLGSGGGAAMGPGLTAVPAALPSLALVYLPVLGTVRVDVYGSSGDGFAFAFGLPADPMPLAGLGDLQLDLAFGPWVMASGTIDGTRYASATYPIASDPALRGRRFGWQALRSVAGGGFALSNLAPFVLR